MLELGCYQCILRGYIWSGKRRLALKLDQLPFCHQNQPMVSNFFQFNLIGSRLVMEILDAHYLLKKCYQRVMITSGNFQGWGVGFYFVSRKERLEHF